MNAVEIEEAISNLAARPFAPEEFAFAFLRAFGKKPTMPKRLRKGTSNRSDAGGVLQTSNIHIKAAPVGKMAELKASPATTKAKFALAADGSDFQAEDRDIFERLYAVRLDRIHKLKDCRELVEPMDQQCLPGDMAAISEEADPAELDDDALLAELGVELDAPQLTELKHVRSTAEKRAAADEVASAWLKTSVSISFGSVTLFSRRRCERPAKRERGGRAGNRQERKPGFRTGSASASNGSRATRGVSGSTPGGRASSLGSTRASV